MNQLGTGSTCSALQPVDFVSYEEHLTLICLVLTCPDSELSIIAFVWFLIHLEIFWKNLGIFLNRMYRLGTGSMGSAS